MEVPVRKVKVGRKWRRVEIYTPDPYTVSSKKFDYPTYVEELIDEQTAPIFTEPDPDLLALFQMKKHDPETDPDKLQYDVKKAPEKIVEEEKANLEKEQKELEVILVKIS